MSASMTAHGTNDKAKAILPSTARRGAGVAGVPGIPLMGPVPLCAMAFPSILWQECHSR